MVVGRSRFTAALEEEAERLLVVVVAQRRVSVRRRRATRTSRFRSIVESRRGRATSRQNRPASGAQPWRAMESAADPDM